MFRWIFFVLLAANCLPVLFAGNADQGISGGPKSSDSRIAVGDDHAGSHLFMLDGGQMALALNAAETDGDISEQTHCYLIGPLASISVAEAIAVEVERTGGQLKRNWREVEAGSDYWVYLPSMPSNRATTRTLQELQANDIDGFIFAEGELEGAIALGAYTDKLQAEQNKERYARLGYQPEIREIGRMAREYWLSSPQQIAPKTLRQLLQLPGIEKIPQKNSRKPCKIVASAMQFQ